MYKVIHSHKEVLPSFHRLVLYTLWESTAIFSPELRSLASFRSLRYALFNSSIPSSAGHCCHSRPYLSSPLTARSRELDGGLAAREADFDDDFLYARDAEAEEDDLFARNAELDEHLEARQIRKSSWQLMHACISPCVLIS